MALGVKPGNAVLVPSFTFIASAEVVPWFGAVPIFVDVDPGTYNVATQNLRQGLDTAAHLGLSTVGVIAVDLFGLPADYEAIAPFCQEHGLWLIGDAAQSFGARVGERAVGTLADLTTTSFFPAKPLGAYGDSGAMFTNDDDTAALVRSLLVHGKGAHQYEHVNIGINGRLDTMQAAVLLEKLKIFPQEIEQRQMVADRYAASLAGVLTRQVIPAGMQSVWAQYCVEVIGEQDRETVRQALRAEGVPTAVYYPIPMHQQPAYRHFPVAGNGLPASERAAQRIFALPMHPYLSPSDQMRVTDAVKRALGAG
jgi:dTDP-4-amino-4,6-dideoxygalactose transaminase